MYRDPEKTQREKDLEYEVQDLRQSSERQRDEEERARAERRRERESVREERERTADTWPEALHKQIVLFRREATPQDEEDTIALEFETWAQACERAIELYQAAEAEIRPKIEKLEAAILLRAINALERDPRKGFSQIADMMRDTTPSGFLVW